MSGLFGNKKASEDLYKKAYGLAISGDLDAALSAFNELLDVDPKHAQAYQDRGTLWCMKKQHENALRDFVSALAHGASPDVVHSNIGNVYSELGASEKALEHFGKSISVNPAYAFAYYNRARVLAASGKQREATADLKQCLRLNPDPPFRSAIQKRLSELGE
jgi:tetratricopeptide (TPR) repeat protein